MDIRIFRAEDWVVIFLNSVKVFSKHSVEIEEVLYLIEKEQKNITNIETIWLDEEEMEEVCESNNIEDFLSFKN